MARGFTLILTRGTHVITCEAATTVARAIEDGQKLVTIELDPFAGVERGRQTTLVTAHIVALAETDLPERSEQALANDNVRSLRPRARG